MANLILISRFPKGKTSCVGKKSAFLFKSYLIGVWSEMGDGLLDCILHLVPLLLVRAGQSQLFIFCLFLRCSAFVSPLLYVLHFCLLLPKDLFWYTEQQKNLFILIITLGCSSRLGSSSSPGWGWSSPSCCSRGRGTPLVDSQPLKHSKWCPSKSHSSDTREVEIFWYVFFFLTFSSFRCVQNMNFQGNCDFVK